MAKRMPSYFPQGAKLRVRDMTMFANVQGDSCIYCDLGQPVAAGQPVVTAQSIATTAPITTLDPTFTASDTQMTRWGRAVQLVASGAATAVMQVRGRDYLGSAMREDITLNGTTPVVGKKAFRYIDSITPAAGTAATTVSATLANVFGLPYKFLALELESKNGHPAANPGTFVAGLQTGVPSTSTTADVRGTYAPATVLPDGVNSFFLRYYADHNNGHGNAQFFA